MADHRRDAAAGELEMQSDTLKIAHALYVSEVTVLGKGRGALTWSPERLAAMIKAGHAKGFRSMATAFLESSAPGLIGKV